MTAPLALALACLVALTLSSRVSRDGPAGEPVAAPRTEGGSLVIVGGGEIPAAIWEQFVQLAGGEQARLVVIPTASQLADEGPLLMDPACACWEPQYETHKVRSLAFLHTRRTDQANDPAFVRPLTEASGVWLDGGDQTLLTDAYRGTLVEREVRNVLARGGVVGGTSAGAAVMSEVMIRGGDPETEVGAGFGLLPGGVVVDQHFSERDRLPRLQGVLAKYPRHRGLGIDERTGVIVHGQRLTVVGNNHVHVCFPVPPVGEGKVMVFGPGDQIDLEALDRAEPETARVE
jgi:cyanophycinase